MSQSIAADMANPPPSEGEGFYQRFGRTMGMRPDQPTGSAEWL